MTEEALWDHSVDVLVVGSGNGAMTAAICCHEMGTRDVLLVEKSDKFGGGSGLSGGGVWIPENRYAKEAGSEDSLEDARTYLDNTIPQGEVPQEMISCYLENGPRMIDFLHEHSRVRYASLAHYPDYYTDTPGARNGHRSMEPVPINASELGADFENLVVTHHMMRLFNCICFTQVEALMLATRAKGWLRLAAGMVLKWLLDIPWLLRTRIARRLCCGSAGIARLFLSLKDRGIPLWLNSPMKELISDEDGKVIGAVIERDGKTMRIKANKAVVLACGGFEANQELREKYLPKPTNKAWSAGISSNTGDGLLAALKLNAATRLIDGAWWSPTLVTPGEPRPRMTNMPQSLPGSIIVNLAGKRFANESQNYMAFQLELFRVHREDNPCTPMYHIFDNRFRKSYLHGPLLTKDIKPDWTIPRSWYEEGFFAKSSTLHDLAQKLGIDADALEATVADHNRYAEKGIDEEFGRGDSAYDRYYGDQTISPNPCLAAIEEAPFYAVRIDAGDIGTHGGLSTNPHAQVLSEGNTPIEGLYACGNVSAAILPTYPGPGATLGPAMTFAYQAAKHITGRE